jgi:hypothetical protein
MTWVGSPPESRPKLPHINLPFEGSNVSGRKELGNHRAPVHLSAPFKIGKNELFPLCIPYKDPHSSQQ